MVGGAETIRALGVLSVGETGAAYARRRDELLRLVGQLPEEDRGRMAHYLRGGVTVFAAMEHTWDVIDGCFETPGGSGILTDGEYYWRRDSADYVEHHGVGLARDFIEHVQELQWSPPAVAPDRVLEVDRYLMGRRSGL